MPRIILRGLCNLTISQRSLSNCYTTIPQDDIEGLSKMINDAAQNLPPEAMAVLVRPIFAALPPEQQMKVGLARTP